MTGRWLVSPEADGGPLWQVVDMLSAYRSNPMPHADARRLAQWRNAEDAGQRDQLMVDEASE